MKKPPTIPDIHKAELVANDYAKLKTLCRRRDDARQNVQALKNRRDTSTESVQVALLDDPEVVLDDAVTKDDLQRATAEALQLDQAAATQAERVKTLCRKASNQQMAAFHQHRRDAIRKCWKMMQPIRELCENERKLDRQLQASNMQGVDHCRFLGLIAGVEPAVFFKQWEQLYKEYL